jgi:hypothetical protein
MNAINDCATVIEIMENTIGLRPVVDFFSDHETPVRSASRIRTIQSRSTFPDNDAELRNVPGRKIN